MLTHQCAVEYRAFMKNVNVCNVLSCVCTLTSPYSHFIETWGHLLTRCFSFAVFEEGTTVYRGERKNCAEVKVRSVQKEKRD